MNAREERGLVIAAVCKLNRTDDGTWLVPSQSGAERMYRVDVRAGTCTCPDHTESGFKCKHVFAVEFTMKRGGFYPEPPVVNSTPTACRDQPLPFGENR